jgi:hypothetical protein
MYDESVTNQLGPMLGLGPKLALKVSFVQPP